MLMIARIVWILRREMNAKERFEQTRRNVQRLDIVHTCLMNECDDWKPPSVRAHNEQSDPTAQRAIYNVDELADKLDALRHEADELETFIGQSLVIIQAVRDGFGEIYANLLERRYIDLQSWTTIIDDLGINRRRCYYLTDIAFDWIDSVGVSRLLRGEVEV